MTHQSLTQDVVAAISKTHRLRRHFDLLAVLFVVAGGLAAMTGQFRPHTGLITHVHPSTTAIGAAASRPNTVVKPVSCVTLPHVPGKSVTTAVVEFPPNAYTPAHRHPGSVTAFVLKGNIRSQMQGGPPIVYSVGQTWFEAPSELHLLAENASATEPAELLAVFVANDGCGPLVIPEPQAK